MRAKPRKSCRALSTGLIVDAVLADGLMVFSMSSIANRLGVRRSGLYLYVADRDDLIAQTMDRITQSEPWPRTGLPWRQHLEQIGETYWKVCAKYPGFDLLALRMQRAPPGFAEVLEPHIESLQRQGIDIVDAVAAIEFVRSLVLTSSITAANCELVADRSGASAPTPDRWSGQRPYRRHLDTWLDGLAQRVKAPETVRHAVAPELGTPAVLRCPASRTPAPREAAVIPRLAATHADASPSGEARGCVTRQHSRPRGRRQQPR